MERNKIVWNTLKGFEFTQIHRNILVKRDKTSFTNKTTTKFKYKTPECMFLLKEIKDSNKGSIIYQSNFTTPHGCLNAESNEFLKNAKIKMFLEDLCNSQKI